MKKTSFFCIWFVLCVWAQGVREFSPEVWHFTGFVRGDTMTVVDFRYDDTQNVTTVVENPAQNAYWVVSHGGLLSHPLLDLMADGVVWRFHGRQNGLIHPSMAGELFRDETKLLPTYVYMIFTHSSENYDSILRTSANFINLLPMEVREVEIANRPPPSVSVAQNRRPRSATRASRLNVNISNNNIRFSQNLQNATMNIYTPSGRMVYSARISGTAHNLPNMARGVYFLRITGAQNAIIFNGRVRF